MNKPECNQVKSHNFKAFLEYCKNSLFHRNSIMQTPFSEYDRKNKNKRINVAKSLEIHLNQHLIQKTQTRKHTNGKDRVLKIPMGIPINRQLLVLVDKMKN